ncbi:hypothetical protein B0H13DRAFT_2016140 [Mycena leptocephala]|nr:hypothetical protein B0H13DRAFT_2016140 [Mycena leptocephala]
MPLLLRLPAIPTLPWLLFPLTSWDRVSFGEVFIRMIVACVHLARTLAEMVPFGNCIISIVPHFTGKYNVGATAKN